MSTRQSRDFRVIYKTPLAATGWDMLPPVAGLYSGRRQDMATGQGTLTMAKKKAAGRPKAAAPLKSIAALKGTAEFETWLDGLATKAGSRTRIDAIWRGLKMLAESVGHNDPMPS